MTRPLRQGGRVIRGWAGLLLAALLAGCAAPTPTAVPNTATPSATDTPAPPTATLVPSATPGPSPTPSPVPGGLYVDAGQDLGPISPLIFGTNHGPWVAVPFAYLKEAYAAGVTVIRFPGGAWGDRNNVTPLQIDQFAALLQEMGAQGSISV